MKQNIIKFLIFFFLVPINFLMGYGFSFILSNDVLVVYGFLQGLASCGLVFNLVIALSND